MIDRWYNHISYAERSINHHVFGVRTMNICLIYWANIELLYMLLWQWHECMWFVNNIGWFTTGMSFYLYHASLRLRTSVWGLSSHAVLYAVHAYASCVEASTLYSMNIQNMEYDNSHMKSYSIGCIRKCMNRLKMHLSVDHGHNLSKTDTNNIVSPKNPKQRHLG
jgi:hypothetical protein